jgi:hypothetical protein
MPADTFQANAVPVRGRSYLSDLIGLKRSMAIVAVVLAVPEFAGGAIFAGPFTHR